MNSRYPSRVIQALACPAPPKCEATRGGNWPTVPTMNALLAIIRVMKSTSARRRIKVSAYRVVVDAGKRGAVCGPCWSADPLAGPPGKQRQRQAERRAQREADRAVAEYGSNRGAGARADRCPPSRISRSQENHDGLPCPKVSDTACRY